MQKPDARLPYGHKMMTCVLAGYDSGRKAMISGFFLKKYRYFQNKTKKFVQEAPPRQNLRWMQKPDARLPYGHKKMFCVLAGYDSGREAVISGVSS